nr:PREDICTED: uncharacterized protein LOC108218564 isoform X2 [Daucus carota subsp. sativus]
MECKELVAWVPLTPQKVCLESISGVKNCKDPNFTESVDVNSDFCDGKVVSSNGVEITLGVEKDESRCTEKEGQRVTELEDSERNLYCAGKLMEHMDSPSVSTPGLGEKQNTRPRHNDDESRHTDKKENQVGKFEDEERKLHCAENLPRDIDSPSVLTPCPAEKQDSRKRNNDGIDLNKKPKQRPKVKKHRPKIAVDRWMPRKIPKSQTPRNSTPKDNRPSTTKNVNLRGKRYLGKLTNRKGFTSTSEDVRGDANSETSAGVAILCKRSLKFECEAVDKCDCVVESCSRPHQDQFHLRSVEGLQMSTDLDMCSDFNVQSKERGENCSSRFLNQYQRRMRGVDKPSSEANTGINIGTKECTNLSFSTDESQLMFSNPHELEKQSVFHHNNLHDNSKAGCLQFYRRTFRVNQCRQNSRKSGPNFPKIFKKSRTMRLKATTFLTMWSIVDGASAGAKRKGAHGRCKQITRNFCSQINWKVMRKGVRSIRKSKYQRPLSVRHEFQIEKPLLNMILPTKEQTQAALADPESFKCVLGLSPIVKSRGKRSKGSTRQIIRQPLVASYNFEQVVVNTHEEIVGASYGRKVYEPQTLQEPQHVESENHQFWRKNLSEFCNEDSIACQTDMDGRHPMKDALTQILEEVQLMKYENHLNCSLNTESIFLDNIVVHENRKLQPDDSHLDCTLNAPCSFLSDVEAQGSERLQPDENHIGSSLSAPIFILDDVEAHGKGRLRPENYLDCSLNNCLDVVVSQDENNQPRHKAVRHKAVPHKAVRHKAVRPTQECSNYAFVRGLMDIIVRLKYLNIYDECHELVAQDPKFQGGTLVEIVPPKKRKVRPKLALDSETLRMFKLLMDNDRCEYSEDTDRDKNEWWAKEREVFRGRANSLIARMHLMQGDRRFSKWKGSVVDSIVGVFLTQNVGDVTSSSVFIHLAAKYPVKPRNKEIFEDVGSIFDKETVGSYSRGADAQVVCDKCTDVKDDGGIKRVDCEQPCSYAFPAKDLKAFDMERNNKLTGETFNFRKSLELEKLCFLQQFYGAEKKLSSYNVNMELKPSTAERSMQTSVSTALFDLNADPLGISREEAQNKSESNETLELSGSQIRSHQVVNNKCTDVKNDGNIEGVECEQPCLPAFPVQDLEALVLDMDLERNKNFDTGETSSFRKSLELEELGFLQQFYGAENNLLPYNVNMELKPSAAKRSMQASVSTATLDANVNPLRIPREEAQNKSESIETLELSGSQITSHQNVSKKSTPKHYSGKGEKKKKAGTDWEELRKAYSNNNERGKDDDSMDAVDWEAVRKAPHKEVSDVLVGRGMNNVIAARIKDFLERVVKDHGKIDLEWLRDIPPDTAKDFLLSIEGLGLKSVECVRLLTLHHRAFPVDTNVARVAVRLGWVPLAPLPEELKLHLLESYPLLDKIQMYLFPRLCTLDQKTLYELHYQLITFGKLCRYSARRKNQTAKHVH